MDLTTLTDDQLDARRLAVLNEQERRRKLAELPDLLADMARDAVSAGVDPETIRSAVTDALAPQE